jgi:hypothetical protein
LVTVNTVKFFGGRKCQYDLTTVVQDSNENICLDCISLFKDVFPHWSDIIGCDEFEIKPRPEYKDKRVHGCNWCFICGEQTRHYVSMHILTPKFMRFEGFFDNGDWYYKLISNHINQCLEQLIMEMRFKKGIKNCRKCLYFKEGIKRIEGEPSEFKEIGNRDLEYKYYPRCLWHDRQKIGHLSNIGSNREACGSIWNFVVIPFKFQESAINKMKLNPEEKKTLRQLFLDEYKMLDSKSKKNNVMTEYHKVVNCNGFVSNLNKCLSCENRPTYNDPLYTILLKEKDNIIMREARGLGVKYFLNIQRNDSGVIIHEIQEKDERNEHPSWELQKTPCYQCCRIKAELKSEKILTPIRDPLACVHEVIVGTHDSEYNLESNTKTDKIRRVWTSQPYQDFMKFPHFDASGKVLLDINDQRWYMKNISNNLLF